MSFLDLVISFITTYSFDVAIIVAVFLLLAFYGFWLEKNRLTSLILSFYTASFLFSNCFFRSEITIFGESGIKLLLSQAVLFVALLIVSILILNRVIKGRFPPSGIKRWLKIAILSLAGTGFMLSLSYHALPAGEIYSFSAPVASLFEPANMFFWWLFAPLIALFVISKPAV